MEETTEQLNILRNQTVVYAGDLLLSRHAIRQSIKALYATHQYSQIQVYSQDTPDGIVLNLPTNIFRAHRANCALRHFPRTNLRTLSKNAMRSKQGGKFVPTIVNTDAQRIKRVCQAYGYFDAKVTVSNALTEAGTLTYQITVGDASIIKNIANSGQYCYLNESP